MASRKLTEKDNEFIQNLSNSKDSFFFKEERKRKKTSGRRIHTFRGIRCGISFSRSFIGIYISSRGSEYRIGYTRSNSN